MESRRSIDELINEGYQVHIGDYINKGVEIFKQNIGGFIGFILLVFLINLVLGFIPIIGGLASIAISGPLGVGIFIVSAKIMKEEPYEFGDFFKGFNFFLPLLLASLVVGILVVLGMILLIIPGIYLAIAYTFTNMLIVERRMEFWEAMETSRKIVTKSWFPIFGLILLLGLLNLLGMIALCIGILVTAPITSCAMAAAYDDIIGIESTDFEG
ncbi:MAG: hypothetical protein ACE5G0_03990 [Rhodothermales bacterium]